MNQRRALWKELPFWCHECDTRILHPTRNQFKAFQHTGRQRMFCSKECSHRYRGRLSSHRMAASNPMACPAVRWRVSQTMRNMGHRPTIHGGKGRPLPQPQQLLLETLGEPWVTEHVIRTGLPKVGGNPTWYSADLAHLRKRICVEVDGGSHKTLTVRWRDSRRDQILSQLGWTTLRFSNQQVMEDPEGVAGAIMSTISKLRETITISPAESLFTTAI